MCQCVNPQRNELLKMWRCFKFFYEKKILNITNRIRRKGFSFYIKTVIQWDKNQLQNITEVSNNEKFWTELFSFDLSFFYNHYCEPIHILQQNAIYFLSAKTFSSQVWRYIPAPGTLRQEVSIILQLAHAI